MFRLEYHIGNKFVETVLYSAPIAVCKWKSKELKETTHKAGTFKNVRL